MAGPGSSASSSSILIFDVVLLVLIAYLLLADRKIWAAVQMRRGPNVVGPFGLLQTFADLFKFLFKEVIIPAGSNKVIFLIAPLITVILAFAGLGGDPVEQALGGGRHQCRHSLSLRHVVAGRLWHHHGGLGLQFEISLPFGPARRRPDGVV